MFIVVQLSVYAGILAIADGRGYLEHGMHERCNVQSNSNLILYRILCVYIVYTEIYNLNIILR